MNGALDDPTVAAGFVLLKVAAGFVLKVAAAVAVLLSPIPPKTEPSVNQLGLHNHFH